MVITLVFLKWEYKDSHANCMLKFGRSHTKLLWTDLFFEKMCISINSIWKSHAAGVGNREESNKQGIYHYCGLQIACQYITVGPSIPWMFRPINSAQSCDRARVSAAERACMCWMLKMERPRSGLQNIAPSTPTPLVLNTGLNISSSNRPAVTVTPIPGGSAELATTCSRASTEHCQPIEASWSYYTLEYSLLS